MPSAWQIRPSTPYDWTTTTGIVNLHLTTSVSKPTLGPKEALVRIHAAALNARDMMVVSHDPIYPISTIPNLTPCADGAGIIEAVGESSIWAVGERVLLNATGWVDGEVPTLVGSRGMGAGAVEGTLREYAVVSDDLLIRAPSHLSYEELAALPAAAGTAMNAFFFGPTKLERGMSVLTQGTGGVSCFAIQIAAAAGATVTSTSSSDTKLAIARTLGATHCINSRTTPDWASEVLLLTNGKGVDHVIEVAGSSTIEQSLASTKHGGLISLIGFLSESKMSDIVPAILFGAKTIRGVFQISAVMTEAMAKFFEEHKLHPRIAKVYEWGEAKEAFETLVKQEAFGKIVVRVGEKE